MDDLPSPSSLTLAGAPVAGKPQHRKTTEGFTSNLPVCLGKKKNPTIFVGPRDPLWLILGHYHRQLLLSRRTAEVAANRLPLVSDGVPLLPVTRPPPPHTSYRFTGRQMAVIWEVLR